MDPSSRTHEFRDYVIDLLEGFGGISSKAMFSGHAIYKDGRIFALIADGELYFKATAQTRGFFTERGSRPFSYSKKGGKTYVMSYWLVPEEVMEDREQLALWADVAISPFSSSTIERKNLNTKEFLNLSSPLL